MTLKVLEEAAELHQLGDDIDGLLQRADRVELDQLGVPQLLHDVRLGQEILGVHCSWGGKQVSDYKTVADSRLRRDQQFGGVTSWVARIPK